MADPEWDQTTRDTVLALDDIPMCPVCRGPAALCQDPERQDDWVAGAPVRCHAQTARLERAAGVTEKTNPHASALTFPVSLLDRALDHRGGADG